MIKLPEGLTEPVVVRATATLPQSCNAACCADDFDSSGGEVLAHVVVVWRLDVVDLANVAAVEGLGFRVYRSRVLLSKKAL